MNTAVFRLLAQSEDYIRRCLEYAKIYLAIRRDQVAWIAPHLMVDRNPMSGVKFFPEAIKTRFLTDDEIARLRHLMEPRVWEMVAFAIETGLRRSEQFNLRWSQIDMENRVLSLPMPKGSKSRYVPLTDGVCGLLSRWDSFTKSPFVFPGKDPLKPLDARSFVRWYFDPALRRAGIVGASWHSLRHTAATRRGIIGCESLWRAAAFRTSRYQNDGEIQPPDARLHAGDRGQGQLVCFASRKSGRSANRE